MSFILSYLAAVAVLLAVPGPDAVLIATHSSLHGWRHGAWIALGIFVAGLIQTALIAGGLGSLMDTWPQCALAIRLLGALYIGYLGLSAWVRWARQGRKKALVSPTSDTSSMASILPVKKLLVLGIANNLLNPKSLLFFSVFLPQFVQDGRGSFAMQIAVLGGVLSLIALVYNVGLSRVFGARSTRALLAGGSRWARHGDAAIGTVFCLLAARLAVAKT